MTYFLQKNQKMKESVNRIKSFMIFSHHSVITTVNVLMHSVLLLFFPFSIYTYIFLLRSCRSHQTYSSALLCDTMMTWANHKPSLLLIPWQVLPTGRLRKKLEDGRLVKGIASLSSLFYQLHFTQSSTKAAVELCISWY